MPLQAAGSVPLNVTPAGQARGREGIAERTGVEEVPEGPRRQADDLVAL